MPGPVAPTVGHMHAAPSMAARPMGATRWQHTSCALGTQVEARKREVMDQHLSVIMEQTERYSRMLAQNLMGAPEAGGEQLPAPDEQAAGGSGQEGGSPAVKREAAQAEETKVGGSCIVALFAAVCWMLVTWRWL